jgi:hypothetical protein
MEVKSGALPVVGQFECGTRILRVNHGPEACATPEINPRPRCRRPARPGASLWERAGDTWHLWVYVAEMENEKMRPHHQTEIDRRREELITQIEGKLQQSVSQAVAQTRERPVGAPGLQHNHMIPCCRPGPLTRRLDFGNCPIR